MFKKMIVFSLSFTILSGCLQEKSNEPLALSNHVYSGANPLQKPIEHKNWSPYNPTLDLHKQDLTNITYEVTGVVSHDPLHAFPEHYSEVEGVITFRGNHLRSAPAFGTIPPDPVSLSERWSFQTTTRSKWGGGAGWTGQPSIIKWEPNIKEIMNIHEELKGKQNFVEVVYASLDGRIYFFDLETGEQSRPFIDIHNPIKGSVSLDPRGLPLLYVGQGVPETGASKIGYRIYSLIDGSLLHFIKGSDSYAYRNWGAFDGAPLINKDTDTMYLGGENGLFYRVKLNTVFDKEKRNISIQPETTKYRYQIKGNSYQGIENSVAAYKNLLFFSDNGGSIQALDTSTLEPIWVLNATDDTDATLVVEPEEDLPYLYTGTEVDKQGPTGFSLLRKINGLTGEVVWKKNIPALSILGPNPVNGGLLATPIIGKHDISNIIIFTICRYKTMSGGLILALDKETGEEIWRVETPDYSWSSPVDVYTEDGESYIVQADSVGTISLLKGTTGEIIDTIPFHSNVEASPAIYHDTLVVANRGGQIAAFQIR